MAAPRTTSAPTLTDLLFDRAEVGLCLVAPDGTIRRANAEWLRSTGFSLDDVLGVDIVALFPETRDMALAMHARARAGHHVVVPRHAQRIDGRETWWEGSIAPVPMENGTGLFITARQAIAPSYGGGIRAGSIADVPSVGPGPQVDPESQVLRLSRDLELVAEATDVGIWWNELPLGKLSWDRRVKEHFWLAPDAPVTLDTFYEFLHPEDRQPVRVAIDDAVKNRRLFDVTYRTVSPDGRVRWIRALGRAEYGVDGAPARFVGTTQDVTDLKRAEEALRSSGTRFRTLFETMTEGFALNEILCDEQGKPCDLRYLEVNPAFERHTGLRAADVVGRTTRELFPEAESEWFERYGKVALTGEPAHFEAQFGPLGKWFEVSAYRTEPGRFAVVFFDITERRRAEEALRFSEERFRALLTASSDVVYRMSPDWSEMWHLRGRDFIADTDAPIGTWLQKYIHPDDQPHVIAVINDAVRTKSVFQLEHRVLRVDGTLGWTFSRAVPMLDAHGDIVEWFGAASDITARKNAEVELEKANALLRETDRRKDEFLGMLSHELRNPLAPIRNAAYILERAPPNGEQAERARGVLRRQSEHLTRLVDDLLDVTRITRGRIALQKSRIDLRDAVLRAADDYRAMIVGRAVAYHTELPDVEVWADADPTRLNQVVANLLHNAAKFTRRGDEVVVSLRRDGSVAELRVRDTGAGIDADLLPRLFEPFVQGDRTLARSDGGLGLGLALVKGIVELHGGDVRVESAGIGRGTEFVVRLPLPGAAAVSTAQSTHVQSANGALRVLVVDDNKDAAESLADLLRMLGHEADVAYDGPSALAKLGKSKPDVVLCDIGMPAMSGYEVAKAVRAGGNRGVRLVALSGYGQADDVKRAIEAGFDAHVAKPPDPEELARLLA